MKITECKELILSNITIEIEVDNDKLSMFYSRLEDYDGTINWDYVFSLEPIEPEEMEKLEAEYQKYKESEAGSA